MFINCNNVIGIKYISSLNILNYFPTNNIFGITSVIFSVL